MKDQVFLTRDGWRCMVGGKVFGSWECREYALAGMEVEQRRLATRLAAREADGTNDQ